jgi:thiol:disulfide interchange protein DsbD
MFRTLFLVVFLILNPYWMFCPSLTAQIQFDKLYDFDDFGTFTQGPREQVSLKCQFNEDTLVVTARISPNWHLYSVTQPRGGTLRSKFEFDQPEIKLREIRPTTEPRVNSNAFGFKVDIEEHNDSVTWILTFQDKLPSDTAITGRLKGQVCQDAGEGGGGTCVPITVAFEAEYDPDLDMTPLKTQAETVADRFVYRVDNSAEVPPPSKKTPEVQETVNVKSFWMALVFAFFGGIILNVMPCVLPIIGLKILSFFEQAGKSRARAFLLNVCYSLGILAVFLFLAFLSLGLSILFTFDLFNIIMVCVVFMMALSLMDVWTLNVPGALGGKTSNKLMGQEGVLGAFFKGIITTLLAIPCGAPLLSPAVNWADIQIRSGNMPEVFLMYAVIGLGMASPYLLLGAFPECLRFLPKPGEWMETFKKTMGFCLLLAVVWILYFVPMEKMLPTVTLLFALWFVCWLFGHQQLTGRIKKRNYGISAVVAALVIFFSYQIPGILSHPYTLESAMRVRLYGHRGEHWKPYSVEAFEAAQASDKKIIIDFTADWCITCKMLEAQVLQSQPILTLLKEKGIVSFTADCTRQGLATDMLQKVGAVHVPALAIIDSADSTKPVVMIRGFYTQSQLLELLQ